MHSIIIPHRNRNRYLTQCLQSIGGAYRAVRPDPTIEVVVVDNQSVHCPRGWAGSGTPTIRVVNCRHRAADGAFNKPAVLNTGIAEARGDILTFLDCDAIVGPKWLQGIERLYDDLTITRLCYRVRKLPAERLMELERSQKPNVLLGDWFSHYDDYPRSHEGYILPGLNGEAGLVFGNSQFSIRRDVLGDLRFDESYSGRGFEDISFIRTIYKKLGPNYKAEILTDPDHAMFHIEQTEAEKTQWGPPELTAANRERYFADDN